MSSLNTPETEYSVTGSITGAGQSVTIDVGAYTAVGIQITGTWTGTLGFDVTVNGTDFVDANAVPATTTTSVTTATTNGIWSCVVNGIDKFRVFSDAFSTGTANITLLVNDGAGPPSNAVRLLDFPPTRTATGTMTAPSQAVELTLSGMTAASIQVTGTFTATIGFDASVDGINWYTLQGVIPGGNEGVTGLSGFGSPVTNLTLFNVGGCARIRAFTDAHSSGTVTVDIRATHAGVQNSIGSAIIALGTHANDVPVTIAPLTIGARASTAAPTAVSADGDSVYVWGDRRGAIKTVMVDDDGMSTMDNTRNALRVTSTVSGVIRQTATGSLTAPSQSVILDVGGYGSVGIQVTGSWSGTLGFDASIDGTNFVDLQVVPTTGTTAVTTTTINGIWYALAGGLNKVRVFSDALASGTAVVILQASIASGKNFSVPGGSGGTSSTDDAAFALGVDSLTPVGGQFSSTVDTVNDGDTGAFHMTQRRALHTSLRRESDSAEYGTPSLPLTVSGVNLPRTALIDNNANPSLPSVGVFPHYFDGTLWDRMRGNLSDGMLVNLGLNNDVTGSGAHDSPISQEPFRISARARTSDYTAVSNDDTSDLVSDAVGKLITLPYSIPENFLSGVTAGITGTANTSVIAAQGAGLRIYVTQILVTNAHNTVNTVVEIKNDTTVIYRGFAAKGGGGFSLTFPTPLRLAANVALQAANITTGSETYVSASGYKAP